MKKLLNILLFFSYKISRLFVISLFVIISFLINCDSLAQNDHSGRFYDSGSIVALNINSGRSYSIDITKNKGSTFANLEIILHLCWQENSDIYQPEAKALVEINLLNSNEQLFAGWILARHHALSLPKYQNYMIFLNKCY